MSIKVKTLFNFKKDAAAIANTTGHVVNRLFRKFRAWQKTNRLYRNDRIAIRCLLDLNDKTLRDIGISRADIIWASKLPRDQIATLELQKIARTRHN